MNTDNNVVTGGGGEGLALEHEHEQLNNGRNVAIGLNLHVNRVEEPETDSIGISETKCLLISENKSKPQTKIKPLTCFSYRGEQGQRDAGVRGAMGAGGGGEVWDGLPGTTQRAGVANFVVSTDVQSAAAMLGEKPVLGDSTQHSTNF